MTASHGSPLPPGNGRCDWCNQPGGTLLRVTSEPIIDQDPLPPGRYCAGCVSELDLEVDPPQPRGGGNPS